MGDRVVDVENGTKAHRFEDDSDCKTCGAYGPNTEPGEACREPEPGAPTEVVDDDDTTLPIIEHGRLRR
jgi:hypothetical protein